VPFEPGNLTAEALSEAGDRLGSHTVLTPGVAAGIRLRMVSPSPVTGTGETLVADGQDVAMVSAEVIDAAGEVISARLIDYYLIWKVIDAAGEVISAQDPKAASNITFMVVAGGGRVLGIHSGSPGNVTTATPDGRNAYPAHHGMLPRRHRMEGTHTLHITEW